MNNEAYNNFINQDYTTLSNWLFSLSPLEFSLLGATAGFFIAPTLTPNDQNSLGNFFTLIGQVLMTFNAQNITKSQLGINFDNFKPFIQKDTIEEEIIFIKKEIIKIIDGTFGNEKSNK